MADTSNLLKRGHTYFVRVYIPRHLWDAFDGRREFVRSLKTHSLTEANRLKYAPIAEFHKLIAEAEQATGRTSNNPMDKLLADLKALRRQRRLKLLSEDDVAEAKDALLDQADTLYERGKIPEGDVLAIRTALSAINDDGVATLSDAIETYQKEDEGRLRPSTLNKRRKALEDFLTWRGDCELGSVLRAEAGRYVSEALLPRKLDPATAKHILGGLSGFWHWACGRGIAETNPFDRMARTIKTPARGVRKDEDKDKRPWKPEELLKLLTETPQDSDLWAMSVLALYTGCRVNELAEMQCVNVHNTHLSIPEAKTKAGRRDVPIHPRIAKLVAHLKETSSDGYLVSGLKRGGYDKKRHHMFAKRFSYHKSKVLELPPAAVFHGLRKNFITSLHNAGVAVDRIQQIVGHERGSLALDVYSAGVDLKKLAKEVKMVTFGKRVDALVAERIAELVL